MQTSSRPGGRQQRKYGFHCETCQAHRLHQIAVSAVRKKSAKPVGYPAPRPGQGQGKCKRPKTIRIRICSACGAKTLLTSNEQPGIACPKCSNIRFRVETTRPIFNRRKVDIAPGLHSYEEVPAVERVRICTHCTHRIRTTEEVECLNV